MDSREDYFKSTLDLYNKCAKIVKKHINEKENQNEYIENLNNFVADLANLDMDYEVSKEAIEEAKKEFNSDPVKFDEVYRKKLENSLKKKRHVQHHRLVKKFREKLQLINFDEENSDLSPKTQTLIDPITKNPISNPVKNKKCGHIYEKSSIQEMLKQRKKIKCPYIGCAGLEYFTFKDLDVNVDLSQQNNEEDLDKWIEDVLRDTTLE